MRLLPRHTQATDILSIETTEIVDGPFKLHPEYQKALSSTPGGLDWFNLLTQTDPAQLCRAVLSAFLRHRDMGIRLKRQDFQGATLMLSSSKFIKALSGADIKIPRIVFQDTSAYVELLSKMDLDIKTAVTVNLSTFEIATQLGLTHISPEVRDTSLMITCLALLDDDADEKIRHEEALAIDPKIEQRKTQRQGDILNEIIATVCEADNEPVYTSIERWAVLMEQFGGTEIGREFVTALRLKVKDQQLNLLTLEHGLSELIYRYTTRGKNLEIARQLMNCVSFIDLNELFERITQDEVLSTSEGVRSDIKIATAMPDIQRSLYYYQGWPTVYCLSSRRISSVWQRDSWARQAMEAFKNPNVAVGTSALEAIEALYGRKVFNKTGIKNFRTGLTEEKGCYRIIVEW